MSALHSAKLKPKVNQYKDFRFKLFKFYFYPLLDN